MWPGSAPTRRRANGCAIPAPSPRWTGGHGAVLDLPFDAARAAGLGQACDAGAPIAAVCHGPGGLVGARRGDGWPLVSGYRVSGCTNSEEAAIDKRATAPLPK